MRRSRRTYVRFGDAIARTIRMQLPIKLFNFLEIEAKRLSEERKTSVDEADIIKALVVAYYEKRMAGLLVSPND